MFCLGSHDIHEIMCSIQKSTEYVNKTIKKFIYMIQEDVESNKLLRL